MENITNVRNMIEEFKNGNTDIFPSLIATVQNDVYKVIYAITKNENNTLEIFDDVIYKAYINLEDLRQVEYFKTWIIRIAINEANANLKQNARVVNIEDYIEIISNSSSNSIEQNIDINNAINTLETNIKEVLILKCYMEYTFEEISNMLGKSSSTIKTWYYKGIEQLKMQMLKKGGELYE